MYVLTIRFREQAPDPSAYKCVGEVICNVCGVGYNLHIRVEEYRPAEQIQAAKLRFLEFLSQSTTHHNDHLSVVPVVVGLGDT